jgi:23S rRNA (adenine2503-C2)-methyltransferase
MTDDTAPTPEATPFEAAGQFDFFGQLPQQIDAFVMGRELPKFRGKQLRSWVYTKLVNDIQQMSDLSKRDRDVLLPLVDLQPGSTKVRQDSTDGTIKLLTAWKHAKTQEGDPQTTETVMIPDNDRRTACVSSQVGCPVGCKFCASGLLGLKGNLQPSQIVYQIFALNQILAPRDEKITNIVFMGMGEPLANYANVMKAIRILHDRQCFDLGARRITISTVGVPPRIRDLAKEELPVNLALSLHAPNEALRRELIPWANHFALDDILGACRYYFDESGREITLEYILLHDVNDRPSHARQLVEVCKTIRANVNLIRYNEVETLPFQRPRADDVVKFQSILRDAGINTHVRKSRGRDIAAACGQLRRRHEEGSQLQGSDATRSKLQVIQ